MSRSFAQAAELTCFHCGRAFGVEVWLTVDAAERPDLVAAIQSDTLHVARCPHCGAEHPLTAPVLFHDAGQETLIFAQSDAGDADREQVIARQLGQQLIATIPPAKRGAYLAKAQSVVGIDGLRQALNGVTDSDELSIALQELMAAETPDAVAQVFGAHVVLAVPDVQVQLREYVTQLRDIGQHEIAGALEQRLAALPATPPHPTLYLIQALLDADGPDARQRVLQADPGNVTPDIPPILEALARQAQRRSMEAVARDLLVMRDEVLRAVNA